jgi:uncharacterized protein with FMN-binding domain
MRRAIVATAGTVVGLVALLSYKSSGPHNGQRVQVNGGQSAPVSSTLPPATAGPATTGPPTTGPPTTGPAISGPPTTAPPTTAPPVAASAERTYDGQDIQYVYGDIVVNATLRGGRILNVSVPQNDAVDGRSQMINSYAVPILEQEAVAAQGVNINVVSGATFTSDAFAQSLQSALSQAGK